MDADNSLKILNDGIAAGLGIDDRWLLPCVEEIRFGDKDPRVELEIEDA